MNLKKEFHALERQKKIFFESINFQKKLTSKQKEEFRRLGIKTKFLIVKEMKSEESPNWNPK